ncbi:MULTISPECIES: amidase [Bacillaceae]|uniref:amidase n=1 Tax=Bacillaceae TaxID=186817 RepID=UPI000E72627D|nr:MULTISPECIES: amidase [Bacillus]RJS61849.1 hypothetical protein CJ483_18880 [Bacillus sp. PK3_68]UAT32838.1 amidase [Bacillus badius]GLY11866.1 hypothetical protein Bbad01_30820 [Bacillus badius]
MYSVKNVCLLIVMAFMAGSAVFLMTSDRAAANEVTEPRSTWLWDTQEIVTSKDKLLAFMQDRQVGRVYLQIDQSISTEHYKEFIKQAAAKGIQVHALDGAPSWVSSKGLAQQRSFFSWVTNYQVKALPEEKFKGIHLDVEPYLYEGWNSQYKKTVLAYQTLLIEAHQSAQRLGLPLAVDIPFWFDEKNYSNTLGKGKLSEWVIANTDAITIMAYRDTAGSPNGIMELVRNEMNNAAAKNKKVSVGVETVPSTEADFVSFSEEGETYMWEQLAIVKSYYGNLSSFEGFSIHSLQSWMAWQS